MPRASLGWLGLVAFALPLACGGAGRERPSTGDVDAGSRENVDSGTGGTGFDPRTDGRYTEYGSAPFAIYLSSPPPTACWFVEKTIRVCGGAGSPTRDDYAENHCVDDTNTCDGLIPDDRRFENETCWTDISFYKAGLGGHLYGTCAQLEQYEQGGLQCLYHDHCPEGRLCTDYACICPPGVDCACLSGRPIQPRHCEGDVLVDQRVGEGCDENDQTIIIEDRTNCADQGGTCDPVSSACTGGVDGGVDGGIGGSTDGGGNPGGPDAGCMCPPQLPPRCEGDAIVSDFCDPVTCEVGTTGMACGPGQTCDPATVTCVEAPECTEDADCPGVTSPPGQCVRSACVEQMCVAVPC